jgi:hypothetical protein
MESDGKGHLRQQETAFFEEKKANFTARTGRRIALMLPQIGLKENSVQSYA